jgi:hypothetical protein
MGLRSDRHSQHAEVLIPSNKLVALIKCTNTFTVDEMGAFVKKAKLVFLGFVVTATFLIQPSVMSQATAPVSSVPSLNPQLLGASSMSFGQLGSGSALERRSHDGVYYPTRAQASPGTPASWGAGPVTYHTGGGVISRPNVYVIWYGNWDLNSCSAPSEKSTTPSILRDLMRNIGQSNWNQINTTYSQKILGETTYVTPSVNYSGCIVDSGSLGQSLDAYDPVTFNTVGPQISDVVNNALVKKELPTDANGVYFVLTSKDIAVADFLKLFCAYHSSFISASGTIKYAFVGDASLALSLCAAQITNSPNNNPAADAMVSVAAHELVEAVSDPEGASWYDQAGYENADKCVWIFGTATKSENGSFTNMSFGGRQYLIQQNVAANTNICISALSEKSARTQSHSENKGPTGHNG